jgi:hypothetical protein
MHIADKDGISNNILHQCTFMMLATSVVDHDFKPWLGQTADYKIGISCFSVKHAALRSKSKNW